MAKDATAVRSVDANCEMHFAPVGSAAPTTAESELTAPWGSAGYLEDPPDFSQERPTSDITAWNSDDPIRTLIESVNVEVTLKLQQTSALAIELYWGLGDWTSDGGTGAIWTPKSGSVEKAGCLHLTDGEFAFRFYAARWGISSVGALNLTRAQAVSYEVTLKRLAGDFKQFYNWLPDGVEIGS